MGIINYSKQAIYYGRKKMFRRIFVVCICSLMFALGTSKPLIATAEEEKENVLHAFYPANAVFSKQIQKYIDGVDSLSFAWSRIDSKDPTVLHTVKGKDGNDSFYYPMDYVQVVEYAKNQEKSIQLNIYMDSSDCAVLLPYEDKRQVMIQAIMEVMRADITKGKEIYYDGVVIDFEGLRNTDSNGSPILYKDKQISTYYTKFLTELKLEMVTAGKKLYVAVNPGVYYDGYDYSDILDVADRVILMAHDYEPTERLQKDQVQQYTGYDALKPVLSMAPINLVRRALNELQSAAHNKSELSKVWLQIAFDTAQWQFDVKEAKEWEALDDSILSREERRTPLYKTIKARVDNIDGFGENIIYGYNNELQSPYIQYFNTSDQSFNIILYESSNSILAKINLAKAYGLGGISLWSLGNVPDYTDTNGLNYHLDGWTTIIDAMNTYGEQTEKGSDTIKFKDTAVEQAVREKLGKQTGKITIAEMQSIYRIKLSKGVKSLSDLKYLTNLEYLDAKQLGLKDITPLENLNNLRVLYLQRNNITDIKVLKKLTKLEILSLNGNQVVSIEPLSTLTKLQELYLRENKIESITSLAKLTKLEVLELGKNQINKIDTIKNLKKLRQLGIENNKITDISALKGLSRLEFLYMQRNSIGKIVVLSGLGNLKVISLNGNKIKDLNPLAKLTSLDKLYLKDNLITSVTPLKGLVNLKELYLGGNRITNYSTIKTLYAKADFSCDFNIK